MTERPTLIPMAGMPGTGKWTVADALGRRLALPVIDKDVILTGSLDAEVTAEATQPAAYGVLFALSRALVRDQRLSVIVDSPLAFASTFATVKGIADDAGAMLIPVLCLADCDVRNQRVAERLALRSQSVQESRTVGMG